jgi:hypothetical protein
MTAVETPPPFPSLGIRYFPDLPWPAMMTAVETPRLLVSKLERQSHHFWESTTTKNQVVFSWN